MTAAFINRRLHSLMGLWLAFYLFQHLFVNAHAAFFFLDQGSGFIEMVNRIHALPYLKVIEITVLGLPFLIHGLWGIAYLRTAKYNSFKTDGTTPFIDTPKNRAFTWQRLTSWILLVGILAHVIHMRFVDYPHSKDGHFFLIQKESNVLQQMQAPLHLTLYDQTKEPFRPLKKGEVLVEVPNAGTAFLLVVRETFSNPLMVILYTILVLAATFHAYNGLWTAMIKWGVLTTDRLQRVAKPFTITIMGVVTLFGLIAVWGSYLL